MLRLRGDLASIGEVDEGLLKEAKETEERYAFLKRESEDLEKAKTDLKKLIGELGAKIAREFGNALTHINEEFNRFFEVMFGGGHAKLKLHVPKAKAVPESEEGTEETQADAAGENGEGTEEPEEGIEIDLRLPRKRVTSLDMLSGGERSLVGIAALFALVSVSPPPFLVLDEIDAALDERNARRFSEMLKEFSKKTQFIIVTHNRATMEIADVLYGVTMDKDDTSKVVSVKLDTHEGVSR
jgi:chromosome segregation protein